MEELSENDQKEWPKFTQLKFALEEVNNLWVEVYTLDQYNFDVKNYFV